MQIMTTEHPKWNEFYRHLSEMLDLLDDPNPCSHTMNNVEVALEAFGFSVEEIAASVAYFKSRGARCHCEVLLRFGPKAMDDLARLREVVCNLDQRIAWLER